jgi:phenylacetate-coenzyme A ligase PaaK-like adenylate-forming protein
MPTSNLHGALTGTSATRVNPIEVAAPERVRAAQADLLTVQLTYLQSRSVFYQRKLARAGVEWSSLRRIEDLARVPFTVKQELQSRRSRRGVAGCWRGAGACCCGRQHVGCSTSRLVDMKE